jgi:hypothetical protein
MICAELEDDKKRRTLRMICADLEEKKDEADLSRSLWRTISMARAQIHSLPCATQASGMVSPDRKPVVAIPRYPQSEARARKASAW